MTRNTNVVRLSLQYLIKWAYESEREGRRVTDRPCMRWYDGFTGSERCGGKVDGRDYVNGKLAVWVYKVGPSISNFVASATSGSLGGAEPMTDCAKPPFLHSGLTCLKLTKVPWHLYILLQGAPACVLTEYRCCFFLFLVILAPAIGNARWYKKK